MMDACDNPDCGVHRVKAGPGDKLHFEMTAKINAMGPPKFTVTLPHEDASDESVKDLMAPDKEAWRIILRVGSEIGIRTLHHIGNVTLAHGVLILDDGEGRIVGMYAPGNWETCERDNV